MYILAAAQLLKLGGSDRYEAKITELQIQTNDRERRIPETPTRGAPPTVREVLLFNDEILVKLFCVILIFFYFITF